MSFALHSWVISGCVSLPGELVGWLVGRLVWSVGWLVGRLVWFWLVRLIFSYLVVKFLVELVELGG